MKNVANTVVIIATIAASLMMIFPVNAEEDLITPLSGAINSSELFITIDPIGNHTIGEVFFINGTTNLPISENLSLIAVISTDVRGVRRQNDPGIVVERFAIFPGSNSLNYWTVNVSEGYWIPREYVVFVFSTSRENTITSQQSFNIIQNKPSTISIPTPQLTSSPLENQTQINSENRTIFSSQSSSLPTILSILVVFLAGIALLISKKYRKWK